MSLQVFQAFLEAHPIRISAGVLDLVKLNGDLAAGDFVRSRHVVRQASVSTLEGELPWL